MGKNSATVNGWSPIGSSGKAISPKSLATLRAMASRNVSWYSTRPVISVRSIDPSSDTRSSEPTWEMRPISSVRTGTISTYAMGI